MSLQARPLFNPTTFTYALHTANTEQQCCSIIDLCLHGLAYKIATQWSRNRGPVGPPPNIIWLDTITLVCSMEAIHMKGKTVTLNAILYYM